MVKVRKRRSLPHRVRKRTRKSNVKFIGIMHSGTDKKHDDHIKAFKAGLKWGRLL